jgi:hypothetical protein
LKQAEINGRSQYMMTYELLVLGGIKLYACIWRTSIEQYGLSAEKLHQRSMQSHQKGLGYKTTTAQRMPVFLERSRCGKEVKSSVRYY